MKKVMFGDRLFNRVKQTEFVVFDCTSRENEARETNWHSNLKKAAEEADEIQKMIEYDAEEVIRKVSISGDIQNDIDKDV